MKKLVRITFVLLIAVVYFGSLKYKDSKNQKAALKEIPTMPQMRSDNGIPVYAKEINKNVFERQASLSGFISKNNTMKAFATPQERKLLKVGLTGNFTFQDKKYEGRIESISTGTALLSGLFEVKVKFGKMPSEATERLAVILIAYEKRKDVIVLKRDVVTQRTDKPFVYGVDKDLKLVKKELKIEAENNEYFMISEGLEVGDLIVTSDSRTLKSDDKVYISKKAN